MRCHVVVLLISLMAWLAGTLPVLDGAGTGNEVLSSGAVRERTMAAGEKHGYTVEVKDTPVLVTVEQIGIDLVVEALQPGEPKEVLTDALNGRWGPEVLVLSPAAAGGTHLEVRAAEPSVPTGRYSIRVEELSSATDEEEQRVAALTAMSRANQLAGGSPESQSQALTAYRQALATWHALGDRRWEAESQQAVAVMDRRSGDLRGATAAYQVALTLWRGLAAPARTAVVLRNLGMSLVRTGENEAAREALQESLALWQSLGQPFEEGMTRGELCIQEVAKGELSAALACYDEARENFRAAGTGSQEWRMLNNLGAVYDLLGEPDAALDHYGQALALERALGDRNGEARTLNNVGKVHDALGDWQEALRIYAEVQEVLPSLGDLELQSLVDNNRGFTYLGLGEPQLARAFLERALAQFRRAGATRQELITLNNLGDAWRKLGDLKQALTLHRQALERAADLNDLWLEATTRLDLAEVQLAGGEPDAALREIEPALRVFRAKGLVDGELRALQLQGRAIVQAGRPLEALPALKGVLARRQSLRDRAGEAETLHALAVAERSLGLLEPARQHAKDAVARVEELRTGFVSPRLRIAFLAMQRRTYSLLIDLLMDRQPPAPGPGAGEALVISEQARARSLLDALYGNAARAGSAVPAELVTKRRSLHRRISALAYQQLKQEGAAQVEGFQREIDLLLNDLDGVETAIGRSDPQYAALGRPEPVGAERIAGLLDPGTLLLEYSLGEKRSFLWTLGSSGLRSFELPPQRDLESLARKAYEELSTVESGAARRPSAAEALSRVVLQPAWSQVARSGRLAVVPDGALHLLPFAALPVPAAGQGWSAPAGWKPLLESHEVVYLPSATTLALQRQRLKLRSPAPRLAAVVADPVFVADDPRVKAPAQSGARPGLLASFERLSSSQQEAKNIAGLAPAGQVRNFVDFAASRATVLAGDFRPYRVVHFATHGIADTRTPELSGLVLSLVDEAGKPRDGFLALSDIYGLELDADLVVLSGCRTAVGKEIRGEGIMGLTRAFLYAGVPRVVASLWRVEDRTTATLMARFYAAMWRDHQSPAAALRTAQRSLRSELRYRDPYSWAGFVLQGDWR